MGVLKPTRVPANTSSRFASWEGTEITREILHPEPPHGDLAVFDTDMSNVAAKMVNSSANVSSSMRVPNDDSCLNGTLAWDATANMQLAT